jgi:plastocyanin
MLHNMTAQAYTLYLRVQVTFLYGTAKELLQAKHLRMHALTPLIFGGTYNVPRAHRDYVWPQDLSNLKRNTGSETTSPAGVTKVVPGVGLVWTSPWDGKLIVGAGHRHAGGIKAVVSDWGSKERPCANADGDRFPGLTYIESREITRNGVFPSNDYQMGLAQPRWRAWVHKGDRLVLNGVYDARRFAFPDAMVFFGLYVDRSVHPRPGSGCSAWLDGRPKATHAQIVHTVLNHPWSTTMLQHACTRCDHRARRPAPGPATTVVHIAGMTYLPGAAGNSGQPAGPPVVTRGQDLRFVNEDYPAGAIRHTVTACKNPCNGPEATNYPFPDGRFDSGVLGYMWEDAYVRTNTAPSWILHTAGLEPGYYTYYCRLHPFMRGSFYVTPKKG